MLKYGEVYLDLNDQALERLAEGMSPAATELARAIAAEIAAEEEREEADELEAA